jgi:hypothetical protein
MSLTKVSYSMIKDTYVNVVDYGAVGDGATNNSAAFQAAINASEGKTLYIPAGSYILLTAVTLVNNLTILGDGQMSKIITGASAGQISASNKTNITLRQINFTNNSNGSNVPTFTECTTVIVDNCYFDPTVISSTTLRFQGSVNILITNSYFYDADSFIYLDSFPIGSGAGTQSDSVVVQNCYFQHRVVVPSNNPTGVYQYFCKNLLVDGCTFVNIVAGGGIPIAGYSVYEGDGAANSLIVTNCRTVMTSAKPHVMVLSAQALRCTVTNNYFDAVALGVSNGENHLFQYGGANSLVNISGNISYHASILVGGGGTTANALNSILIHDNLIFSVEQNTAMIRVGVGGTYYVYHASVKNNTCMVGYASGITLSAVEKGVVENNRISNWNTLNRTPTDTYAYTAGIYIESDCGNIVLRNNFLEKNTTLTTVSSVGFCQYGIAIENSNPVATLIDNQMGTMLIARTVNCIEAGYNETNNFFTALQTSAPTINQNLGMSYQLVSNTQLKIAVKGSDGSVRSNTLTLS